MADSCSWPTGPRKTGRKGRVARARSAGSGYPEPIFVTSRPPAARAAGPLSGWLHLENAPPAAPAMIFPPTDSQKVFLHTERLAAWLRDGRSFPVTVELDATNVCNHACSFCCWSVLHDRRRDTMSWDFMAKVLDDIASVGVKAVIWTGGGEPLVNQHTPAGMERARAAGMRNALFTNGALLGEAVARRLVESCDWIRFSLAAGTPSEYQRIQGVDDFDLVRRNVAMVVDLAR